ncbi:tRNA pseudouridine(13) synthase TruD [Haloplanus rubicundus]|uniref:Probable tRNA pseudouridine synthase D n=1 Tax=Haloplanus rubicundus TaxID=1547898 RepID=A0A345EA66_9EURY|nr:tRNA pseudouridine(13) synthase TruD [Haloplanus rubicundus]AXG09088.1 tRNA pseudouridine(13) synthase TruD [Haloplanus rubicundus]
MREAHPLERQVGIDYYVSDGPGVGGHLRDAPADFRVRELEGVEPEPLDADPGAYPHLLVRATLTDWDTNDFAGALSSALEVSRERVSWAGTKDKRAVTTQLFSVQGVDAGDLPDLSGADIEALGRIGRNLEFGDLAGNAFEIRIADPERPDEVDAVTDALREFGGGRVAVPNVFGHQRFGSRRPVTHEVGLHVVREEWREAVLAYVGNPAESEPDRTQEARATVDTVADSADPDWQVALDATPGHLGYERSMLHALVENGGAEPADFRAALETVPWNLQRLFVNAAQSYAFNRMLSKRLRRGLPFDRPVAGDVVAFADADAPEGLPVPDTDRLQRVSEGRVDVVTRHCERGRAFVTAPLVGTETGLGDGEPGEIAREVLADLDLAPADFDLPGNFESTGTRRAILVGTDLDVARDPLTLSFSLPRGSYATAVLREFLKVDPRDL